MKGRTKNRKRRGDLQLSCHSIGIKRKRVRVKETMKTYLGGDIRVGRKEIISLTGEEEGSRGGPPRKSQTILFLRN